MFYKANVSTEQTCLRRTDADWPELVAIRFVSCERTFDLLG
jgi:hypothetical protein